MDYKNHEPVWEREGDFYHLELSGAKAKLYVLPFNKKGHYFLQILKKVQMN